MYNNSYTHTPYKQLNKSNSLHATTDQEEIEKGGKEKCSVAAASPEKESKGKNSKC